MTWKDLLYKMKAMRDAQKEYFRTRSSTALAESKMLEKEVDDIVARGMDYYNRMDRLEGAAKTLEEKGFQRQ